MGERERKREITQGEDKVEEEVVSWEKRKGWTREIQGGDKEKD